MKNFKHLIDGEQAFSIYSFSAKWSELISKGNRDDNTPHYCRCTYCKEQIVIRIGH